MSYIFLVVFLAALATARVLPPSAPVQDDIIDLTYPYDEKSETFPINPRFKLIIGHRGPWDANNTGITWLENNNFAMAEHTGSHMDAPAHFTKNGARIDKLQLHALFGPGVKIDVTNKTKDNPDYQITVQDALDWEKKYYRIPNRAIIIFQTGWGKFYNDMDKYYGNTEPMVGGKWKDENGSSILHYPGCGPELAEWLLKERNISGIGSDALSIEDGQATTFPVHKTILNNGLFGLENVANVDKLPEEGTIIYAAPMNIRDGSGAPTRIFAIKRNGGETIYGRTLLIVLSVILCMRMFY